ncbi:sensor histidine kinase, partial [Magnetococcales bacterium HHB-1]
ERGAVLAVADVLSAAIERTHNEERILHSREQLRQLSFHIHSVREEEKKRIAGEIHDELGSILTKLKMDLVSLTRNTNNPQEQIRHLTLMSTLTDRAIRTVRQISTSLRPKILDQLGLLAAIEWQIDEFIEHSNIPCILKPSDDIALDEQRRTALFRICQEALTNAARHSQATEVSIQLSLSKKYIILIINDNGIGSQKKLSQSSSNGIRWMLERAAQFDGTIELTSIHQQGTLIRVQFPRLPQDKLL